MIDMILEVERMNTETQTVIRAMKEAIYYLENPRQMKFSYYDEDEEETECKATT